ncbi:Retrotransposable element Tf2 protein type 1, partial [Aphis craccivora]
MPHPLRRHIGTSNATSNGNFSLTSPSVVTPEMSNDTSSSCNPLSNSTNYINVNNGTSQQLNDKISDTNSVVMALIEQNQLLMERLLLNQSITPSPSVRSNVSNGYYVMPDFHETLSNFIGTEISDKYISNFVTMILYIGSPVSLLKEKLCPLECIPHMPPSNSGIVGINGSELIILNQSFVDIHPPDA